MNLSDQGARELKRLEGLRLKAYRCSGGRWTVGYGSTTGVREGMVITLAEAEARFGVDVARFERFVRRVVRVPLTQPQFDALVLWSFNVGDGPEPTGSRLLRKVNASDFLGAADEFVRFDAKGRATGGWIYSSGAIDPVLVKRRRDEAALFLTGFQCI